MPAELTIEINPDLDLAELAEAFGQHRRLQVRDFLTRASADQIRGCVQGQARWNLVYRAADKHVDSDAEAVAKWAPAERARLDQVVYDAARYGFQYRYASVPIYDIYHGQQLPGHFFNALFRFLNDTEFLSTTRTICGDAGIGFADAQATRYGPGDFLTCHDDDVAGKNRRVAYVLNLTENWRPDWGGILCFLDDANRIVDSFAPAYNSLSLFAVPTRHMVTFVAPYAAECRYAITGWLRAGPDPMLKELSK